MRRGCTFLIMDSDTTRLVGLTSKATTLAAGTISCGSSNLSFPKIQSGSLLPTDTWTNHRGGSGGRV
jgi:hypothetical protein